MTASTAFLFAELGTVDGGAGLDFSYAKHAGGPALYAHAKEIAPQLLGEDPNDIARVWDKLVSAGASVGRGGLATQAIAAGAQRALARGIGGVKVEVGQPDVAVDLDRLRQVRERLGDTVPLMVDANQQWDRATARSRSTRTAWRDMPCSRPLWTLR